ncbi:hypothetical protein ACS0TY_026168 [Phlomoides rotata]
MNNKQARRISCWGMSMELFIITTPIRLSSGCFMLGGVGSTTAQGMAFGTRSVIAQPVASPASATPIKDFINHDRIH